MSASTPADGSRRALFAVTTEGFLSRLSFGLINLAVPLYALQLGMNIAVIGALTAVNVVIQIVLKPFMGAVTDRVGARRSLAWAIGLRSLVPLMFVVAHAPWELFAIRLFYGSTQAWRDPSLNAVIADVGGKKKVASTFAWYHTAKNTASSVGRAIAGIMLTLTAANYPLVFAIGFAMSVLPLIPVLRGLPADRPIARAPVPAGSPTVVFAPPTGPPIDVRAPAAHRRFDPRLLRFTSLGFLYGITAGMLALFPVIAAKELGLSPAEIGVIMLVSTVVVLVSGPVFGWLADNVSRNLVLLVRAAANTLSSVVLLFAHGAVLTGAGRAVDDMGKAAFRPAWGSIMAEVAALDRSRRARTMSLIDVGEDAGDALGPLLAGWLLVLGGLPAMLGVRIVLAIATEFATWRFTHRAAIATPAPAPVPAAVPAAAAGLPAPRASKSPARSEGRPLLLPLPYMPVLTSASSGGAED